MRVRGYAQRRDQRVPLPVISAAAAAALRAAPAIQRRARGSGLRTHPPQLHGGPAGATAHRPWLCCRGLGAQPKLRRRRPRPGAAQGGGAAERTGRAAPRQASRRSACYAPMPQRMQHGPAGRGGAPADERSMWSANSLSRFVTRPTETSQTAAACAQRSTAAAEADVRMRWRAPARTEGLAARKTLYLRRLTPERPQSCCQRFARSRHRNTAVKKAF